MSLEKDRARVSETHEQDMLEKIEGDARLETAVRTDPYLLLGKWTWKRAYTISLLIHLFVIAIIAGAMYMVVEDQKKEAYVIEMDLTAGGGENGTGPKGNGNPLAGVSFPKALSQSQVDENRQKATTTKVANSSADTVAVNASEGNSSGGDLKGGDGGKESNGMPGGNGTDPNGGAIDGDGKLPGPPGDDVGYFDMAGFTSRVQGMAESDYPERAYSRGIEGTVRVEVSFDGEGNVTNVSLVTSSGSDVLDRHAVKTIYRAGHHPNDTHKPYTDVMDIHYELK